jgi:hypothetical protein
MDSSIVPQYPDNHYQTHRDPLMQQTQLLNFPWLSKEQCVDSKRLQLDSVVLICALERRCILVRKRPILHVYCSISFEYLHILMQCDR